MPRPFRWLALAALLTAPGAARAQLTWTVTYSDGPITSGGFGFADGTAVNGTTLGQLRRDSVTVATDYLSTILDGRSNLRVNWNASLNQPSSGVLASFGYSFTNLAATNGSFDGGPLYQRVRTNASPLNQALDGSGQVNFGITAWHYGVPNTNTTLSSSTYDLISVLAHEITHAAGFLDYSGSSSSSQRGRGLNLRTRGTPDAFSTWDRQLQKGNVPNTNRLFTTDVTQSNYGSYALGSDVVAYTGGGSSGGATNTTTGLFFGGAFANEVFGAPVPLYSPSSYSSGSSVAHDNVAGANVGLMNYAISSNVVRRLRAYEIAMMLDLGYNVYDWNGSSGNWQDGAANLAASRWTTNSGLIANAAQTIDYNINAAQAEAPVLPVYGQVTSNIVLNFRGSGSVPYISNNDIGTVRVARLQLNSTASVTQTIAGGVLNFGQSQDGTASVVVPKIVQQNSGAFVISSALQTNNVATQVVVGNVSLPGASGLTVDGTGTGSVTLSGSIQGTGTLTKAGPFTLTLSGTTSTYGGGTTVAAGTLLVANTLGSALGSGSLTVNGTAFVGGTGAFTGAASVGSAATLTAGASGPLADRSLDTGALTVTGRYLATLYGPVSATDTGVVNTSGDLSLTASTDSLVLSLNGVTADTLRAAGSQSFTVLTFSGTRLSNAEFNTTDFTTAGFLPEEWAVSYEANAVVLNFTPVPEPAHLFLAVAAVAGVRRLRRRP